MPDSIKILILEDNAADAELMQRELRRGGLAFTASVASDKQAFRAALEIFNPDLILADYSVPGFDGLTALKDARRRSPEIPVIVVSGAIGEEFAIETLKAGATDYVLKQRLGRLGSVTRRALKEAEQLAERKRAEQAVRRAHAELEDRVRERTAELARINESLNMEIAERRKAEAAARAERQRLYDVLETLPVYVVLLTEDYRVPFANRFFRERFGESHGKRCHEYLFNHAAPCENCETYKVLKTGQPHHWEWTGPDGRNYDIYDFPFKDTDGARLILEMGIDITELKKAEAELKRHRDNLEALVNERTKDLRASERRLNRSQEMAHLGSWELDVANNRLVWSDEVYKIFGRKPREFAATYEAFLAAVHPDDRAMVDAAYSGSLREKKDSYEIEHRVVNKSTGAVRIVHEKCEHLRDETGRIVRSVGMVHDVTERRQFEEALVRAKEKWELTFDSVPDMIAILDNQHRIVQVNAAMARRLGLKPEECVGLPCYKHVHGLSHPPDFCPHALTLQDGRQHMAEVHEDRLGGDFLISTTPLFDEQGKMSSVHVARDITELKQTETELKRSNENLEQFAYVASHDLQEPLRVMANYSQLLEKRYKNKLDKDADDFIGFIVDAARRMQKLITDLLEYSRAGRKDTTAAEVDCNAIVRKVIASISESIKSDNVSITHDDLPVLTAHETGLIQIFQNLIGNALKFRGNAPSAVHIAVRRDKNEWVFAVRDNGIGIEPQYQERIFQIFQRLHSRAEYPGTGIGLAICKKIVENLGGRIWVESEPGQGSAFYFTIPIGQQS